MTLSMTGEWEWPKRRQLGDRVGVEFKDRVGVEDLVGVAILFRGGRGGGGQILWAQLVENFRSELTSFTSSLLLNNFHGRNKRVIKRM